MITYEKKKARKKDGRLRGRGGKDGGGGNPNPETEHMLSEGVETGDGEGNDADVSMGGVGGTDDGATGATGTSAKAGATGTDAQADSVVEELKSPQQLEEEANKAREKEEVAAEAAKVRAAKDREKRKMLAKWRIDPPPYNSLMESLKVRAETDPWPMTHDDPPFPRLQKTNEVQISVSDTHPLLSPYTLCTPAGASGGPPEAKRMAESDGRGHCGVTIKGGRRWRDAQLQRILLIPRYTRP